MTVFKPEIVLQFASNHVAASGIPLTAARLSEALALTYREYGFPLAEVRPRIEAGVLHLDVWEGSIGEVVVAGASPSLEARMQAYQEPAMAKRPLTQPTLERGVMLATDLSGVSVHSEIDHDGPDGRLTLTVDERDHAGTLGIERFPLRPHYADRIFVVEEIYGVRTGGDMLRLFGSATRDERGDDASFAGTVYYRTPVGGRGAYAEVFGGNAIARREFGRPTPDLRFSGVNAAAVFGYPVHRDIHGYDYILGELEFGRAKSKFGGSKAVSEATAARVYWLRGRNFDHGGLVRFALIASAGVRPETKAGHTPDGDETFVHGRGEFSLIAPLNAASTSALRIEARAQWSGQPLPHVEHFVAGHAPFLRGYAPGEFGGDRGISTTVELSHNIELDQKTVWSVTPLVFASAGSIESLRPTIGLDDKYTVASAGFGSDVQFRHGVFGRAWVAWPLVDGARSRAREPGVYLQLTKSW